MSSVWKNKLALSIFGQSHAPAIGMTLDGLPAGIPIDMDVLQQFLNRRAPGRNPWSTTRKEADIPQFLTGLVDNQTCGAPLTAVIHNQNIRSVDYENLKKIPRPGHADFPAHVKHGGYQDVAGGGHFSGRLTAPLCIAGGIALQILAKNGIYIGAHIASIGDVCDERFDPVQVAKDHLLTVGEKEFPVVNDEAGVAMKEAVDQARRKLDSLGGTIECAIIGLPVGLGEPMFDGMENRLSALMFAIPAIKGIEFGAGFDAATMTGSVHNDDYYYEGDQVKTITNHHGGILGGMTTGMPLLFKVAVKPTSSIAQTQQSVDLTRQAHAILEVHGRHDPCIVPRAVPCVEAVAAICILDVLLESGKL
ncbi:MAG: chorismate synthase [Defluviitaleaceae bacterium]|nr:chorismate synthase [Defluviitaleaceae bacterium]